MSIDFNIFVLWTVSNYMLPIHVHSVSRAVYASVFYSHYTSVIMYLSASNYSQSIVQKY